MPQEVDLVIRNGLVMDGTGGEAREASVAVDKGRIVAVGDSGVKGGEIIDAKGCLVMPGFVDIHTHYDAQVTWANRLNPSTNHGATTVVTGNCGMGFAPCRPQDRDVLIQLMEGVEDIPEEVLKAGLPWDWESFPEYLDFLEGRAFDADVAVQLPHSPLRAFVMGERGIEREPATKEDIAEMARLTREAVAAGALGFSTSRSLNHRSSKGNLLPSITASGQELMEIALGLADVGQGVLQLISDFDDPEFEFDMIRRIVAASGRPLSMTVLQYAKDPGRWRLLLDLIEKANVEGLPIKAQVIGRPLGLLLGLQLSYNPFSFCPSYEAIANHPHDKRIRAMRDPNLKEKILSEFPGDTRNPAAAMVHNLQSFYVMGDPPDYEPQAEDSVAARAQVEGRDPAEYVYDLLLEDDGTVMLYAPNVNFVDNSVAAARSMIADRNALLALGDGGAHCSMICDSSTTTYTLTRWGREKDGMSVPELVKKLTLDNAAAVGLHDRGRIAVGYRADLNVVDFDRLKLHKPYLVNDLPCGRSRLDQRADGYVVTVVNGEVTMREGECTGALPGRLIRGARQTPDTA